MSQSHPSTLGIQGRTLVRVREFPYRLSKVALYLKAEVKVSRRVPVKGMVVVFVVKRGYESSV